MSEYCSKQQQRGRTAPGVTGHVPAWHSAPYRHRRFEEHSVGNAISADDCTEQKVMRHKRSKNDAEAKTRLTWLSSELSLPAQALLSTKGTMSSVRGNRNVDWTFTRSSVCISNSNLQEPRDSVLALSSVQNTKETKWLAICSALWCCKIAHVLCNPRKMHTFSDFADFFT